MKDTEFHNKEAGRSAFVPKMHSPNIQPLLQSLLSTLADIDFEYEREREKLSATSPDINLKIKVLEKLKAQHRERRDPYIRQLAILQQRIAELRT